MQEQALRDVKSRFDASSTAKQVLDGVDLRGRTAIVTGASSGIGIAIAQALAAAGAAVTLAVRDVAAGEAVAADIARQERVAAPRVLKLDLLRLASARDFAADWGTAPLHLLIHNAGLMGPPFALTEDGFESQMAVNYFSPFLLSRLLLPNLRAAGRSRLIMLSSGSHHLAQPDPDDLNYGRRAYDRFDGYGVAKAAANLFTVAFDRRHRDDGITALVLTPGGVATRLGRHATFEDAVRLGWVNEDGSLPQGSMKTPEQGAATAIWAAVAPELEGRGGLYLEDCGVAPLWAPPMPRGWGVLAATLDPQAADRLWQATEQQIARAGF